MGGLAGTTNLVKRKRLAEASGHDAKQSKSGPGTASPNNGAFRDAVDTPAVMPSKMELLQKTAVRFQEAGRWKEAFAAFKKALILCPCNTEVRRQFKEAGVSLASIDPIGNCSCKDFVTAARTRRPGSSHGTDGGIGGIGGTGGTGGIGSHKLICTASQLDMEAVYDLATAQPCTCGSSRVRCEEPAHLKILDSLAVLAGRLGQLKEAQSMGQWLIDLAPGQPQGYLHTAKSILAMGDADADHDRPKAAKVPPRFAARCLYHHGLHNVGKHGDPNSPLAKVLSSCCLQYGQDDYIPELPVETVEMILGHLSLSDLITCSRVSKNWAAMIHGIRIRLSEVTLKGSKSPPCKSMSKLARRFPHLDTTELDIDYESWRNDGLATIAAALHHFRSVETLRIGTWPSSSASLESFLPGSAASHILVNCRSMTLMGVTVSHKAFVVGLLQCASRTLESLTLTGFIGGTVQSLLPKLKTLKASHAVWTTEKDRALLPSVCAAAPNLEVLELGDVLFTLNGTLGRPGYDSKKMLRKLHTLSVGHKARMVPAAMQVFRALPPLPAGMRCIDLTTSDSKLAEEILFPGAHTVSVPIEEDEDLPESSFAHLEAFRCTSDMPDMPRVLRAIEPSLGPDGRLTCLELAGSGLRDEFEFADGTAFSIAYPDRIRSVGLHNFAWDTGVADGMIPNLSFLRWVSQFGNAETISVFPRPMPFGEEGGLVLALLGQLVKNRASQDDDSWGGSVRTIYQDTLRGIQWSEAQAMATKLGITLADGKKAFRPLTYRDQHE